MPSKKSSTRPWIKIKNKTSDNVKSKHKTFYIYMPAPLWWCKSDEAIPSQE